MRTLAALSAFTLVPAVLTPAAARAQAQATVQDPEDETEQASDHPFPRPRPFVVEVASAAPVEMPEPYQPPPDPWDSAADPSQIDWPQDVAAEEAAVDGYDDGYDPQAYTQFQDDLAPYGDWIDDPNYGRVWTPNVSLVGADFTPYYTGGQWMLTEFGWTWVSDWSWGWAPFHYGRWIVIAGFGWCWIPGNLWGPAWVSWRSGGGWVGWAALPPRGVSITTTYGQRSPWRFTRAVDLGARRIRAVQAQQMNGMFRRTAPVANDRVLSRGGATVHINAGPRYIPNATPVRLKAVAPHAFPQRAIYPRPGVNMGARPWIRAARAASTPGRGGHPIGGGAGVGGGHFAGRAFAGHGGTPAAPTPSAGHPTQPRTFGAAAGPHVFVAPTNPGAAPSANTVPRVYDPPPATVPRFTDARPHGFNPPSASVPSHAYDPPAPAAGRQGFNSGPTAQPPRTFGPPATFGSTPTFGAPRTMGAPPADNPARVYNPPPRAFVTAPTVNPTRSFGSAPAPTFNPPAPPARTFAAPPVQHQGFTRPPAHATPPPQQTFSPPASGGFSRPGGGMHFGGRR